MRFMLRIITPPVHLRYTVHIVQYGFICRQKINTVQSSFIYVDIRLHNAQYSLICQTMVHIAQYAPMTHGFLYYKCHENDTIKPSYLHF